MPSYHSGELATIVERSIMGLSSEFDLQDFLDAAAMASYETQWTFPVSTDFKIFWMMDRMKRHLLMSLATATAVKFRYKQIHLNQKFDNLMVLIKDMDYKFGKAIDENFNEFTGVDTYKLFGTIARTGFAYDWLGRDYSYTSESAVVMVPGQDQDTQD